MNRLFSLIIAVLFVSTAFAQSNQYISYKYLHADYLGPINNNLFDFSRPLSTGVQIGYHRDLNSSWRLNVPLRVAVVKYPINANNATQFEQQTSLGLDATGAFKFNNGMILREDAKLAPYLLAGVGVARLSDEAKKMKFNVPLGAGLSWEVSEGFFIQAQSEYRISEFNHMHHTAGFVFQITRGDEPTTPPVEPPTPPVKPADTDGDGIGDDADKCPDVAGLAKFDGCPDTDSDGIQDSADKCPKVAGIAAFAGCPDTDGDGIQDSEDKCPKDKGIAANNGCPEADTDGDGILDKDDKCPNVKGTAANNGCPEADTDGDGILDKDDKCPTVKGLSTFAGCPDTDGDGIQDSADKCPRIAGISRFEGCPDTDGDGIQDNKDSCPKVAGIPANNGCPVVEKEVKEILSFAKRGVKFETSSNVIKTSSYNILDQVVDIMQKHPEYNLRIEGHTDSQGRDDSNLKLSVARAKACMEYITRKGISPSRITYNGYGEARPVADNSTPAGRAENRRVEFDIYFKGR